MREIIKWMKRQGLFQQINQEYFTQFPSYPLVLMSILGARYPGQIISLSESIYEIWKTRVNVNENIQIKTRNGYVEFRDGTLEVRVKGAKLENSFLFKENHQPPASFKKHLVRLAIALENKEPVLLIGPTSFKSLLVQT
jgi:hypothetical protein